jgi:N utilization substance protein B
MSRRLVREKSLQSLFQIRMGEVPIDEAIEHVLEETEQPVDTQYLRQLVAGTTQHQKQIDEVIRQYSVGWELDRMPVVDLTLLRMAIYELLYEQDVPVKVVINEAVELAKVFSTAESAKFVNGVLGKLIGEIEQLRGIAANDSGD